MTQLPRAPLASLVALLALPLACGESGSDPTEEVVTLPTGSEIMRDTVETTIVPDVQAFSAEVTDMQTDIDGFCAAPSEATLATAQDRWRSMVEAWNRVVPYNFGPLDNDIIFPNMIFIESMRQRGSDFTQTVRDGLLRGLEGTDTLDLAYFERQTFDEVGILALEVLLFEDSREGNSTVPADVVADYAATPRKCEYLQGVAARLAVNANDVEQGWTTAFGDSGEPFRETMTGDMLEDGTEPVAALLIAMQQHLDYVKVRKLEAILDAQLSGNFYPNVLSMLDAMEELLSQPSEDSFGLFERMEATDNDAEVELVRGNFEAARAAAQAQDREALTAAIGLIDGNLKREIPDALGVELGLTFTDGD
ncbi:MAG: imelysin family protein [Myxococcota bacterium]